MLIDLLIANINIISVHLPIYSPIWGEISMSDDDPICWQWRLTLFTEMEKWRCEDLFYHGCIHPILNEIWKSYYVSLADTTKKLIFKLNQPLVGYYCRLRWAQKDSLQWVSIHARLCQSEPLSLGNYSPNLRQILKINSRVNWKKQGVFSKILKIMGAASISL